jgi:hypothetical protein
MTERTATALFVLGIVCFPAGAAFSIFAEDFWFRLAGVCLYAPAIGLTIWAGRARRAIREMSAHDED